MEVGSMPLAAVRPWQVQAFVNELSDSGLSPGRLRAVVAALRALYAYAIEMGQADANPADRIVVPSPDDRPTPADVESRTFTTTDQLRAVDRDAPAGFIPDQMLWQLLKVVTIVFVLVALVLAAESI
jgi:site-specific recombinase XerC